MTIIAFAGRIASGKSAVSRGVAAKLHAPWVGFGDAVRSEATKRGIAPTRKALQDLGDELITRGWDAFCEIVVMQATWTGEGLLVVDGVRHIGAIDTLQRRAAPSRAVVVFVEASRARSLERLTERGIGAVEVAVADAHSNEAEVDAVRERADVYVQNNETVEDAIDSTIAALDRLGVAVSST